MELPDYWSCHVNSIMLHALSDRSWCQITRNPINTPGFLPDIPHMHMSKNVKETWCCWSLSRCSYRACTALLLLAFLEVKWHALSTCRGPGSWHPRHSEILPPSSSENSLSTNLSHQSLLLTHSQPGKKKQLYLMFSERNSPIWLNSVNPFSPPPIIALLKC